ncbi:MAG: F0F1 ATP synthase subunit A [Candidatus Aminicenantes bacterium]|nr:F0F1 ATP synthase subunit A [Candidatus Aminicenantes bacterium]
MNISPDSIIFWQWGPITLNATIVFTWGVMGLLVLISWLATRKLAVEPALSRWQMAMETVISYMRDQIRELTHRRPDDYLPFIGTLFLFISLSNFLSFVPGFQPPTGSISTTAALAACVFIAVPAFGIASAGFKSYFSHYVRPSMFMLPFHIIGELSRTLALAVRLFGNVMSGTMIAGILLSVAPLFLPVVMHALGLMIGQIQAYIFAVLATVYIASASRAHEEETKRSARKSEKGG